MSADSSSDARVYTVEEAWDEFPASVQAGRTSNPIRKIVDRLKPPKDASRKLISLSIGDPTKYGNLRTHHSVISALVLSVHSNGFNGYPHSCGYPESRSAVAQYASHPTSPLTEDDVIITSGCSGALEMCFSGLANEGDNVLLPNPGFSLYQTICDSRGIQIRSYRLLPEKGWEADLSHMESLIDGKTRAILVNNPSNPCGSVYSREHLQAIVDLAERYHLPIIADEIYADMVFDEKTRPFVPVASLTKTAPVLAVGGLAKRFLVPGWRVGWILIHDKNGCFQKVKAGLIALSTLILGANSLVQSILPTILHETPQEFFRDTMELLYSNTVFLYSRLQEITGLNPIMPDGAMYLMFGIDVKAFKGIEDDVDFSRQLLEEQSLVVLPGEVFGMRFFARLVVCAPMKVLSEACDRIAEFCAAHSNPSYEG